MFLIQPFLTEFFAVFGSGFPSDSRLTSRLPGGAALAACSSGIMNRPADLSLIAAFSAARARASVRQIASGSHESAALSKP
jgi:hypothetical protein